ncbi:MAG TPA: NUDIX hydrolase [Candidatus Acidoferrum sp.]|nr:NUDIX hydrolase [Candidatus Acidoferrum sp.]
MKPLKSEIVFATPWFQVVGKTMRENESPYYSLKLADYATTLAVTEAGRVLVVRQYRPAVERYTLELPSGLIEPGESAVTTAKRELLEETGYEAGEVEVLGAMDPDLGRLSNQSWGFFASGVRKIAGHMPEEGIEVLEWPLEELFGAIRDGQFAHALHIAIVFQAVLQGKIRST